MSWVRRAWLAVVPGAAREAASFAPPARRPAPGQETGPLAAGRGVVADAVGAPRTGRSPVGQALVAAGLAWFALGVWGMHAFGWFGWAAGSATGDLLFHASGLWVVAAGAALLQMKRGAAPAARIEVVA